LTQQYREIMSSSSSATTPTPEEGRIGQCIRCAVSCLLPLAGFVLVAIGVLSSESSVPYSEFGYVCGDHAPSPPYFNTNNASFRPPCLRVHGTGLATGAGPLCPRAGASNVYCYEQLKGYDRPTAYLWFTCDGGGDSTAIDGAKNSSTNCSAGSWRLFHTQDNALADQYGGYHQVDQNVSGGGGDALYDTSMGISMTSESTEWMPGPSVSVSRCDDDNNNGTFAIPEECYGEQEFYKSAPESSIMIKVGFLVVVSPFLCSGFACVLAILGAMFTGVANMCSGMRRASLAKTLTGLVLTLTSLAALLAAADIGMNCAFIFFFLVFGMQIVFFVLGIFWMIGQAIKMASIKRCGVTVMAAVRDRRRHCNRSDDGPVTYEYELLVMYDAPHHSSWRSFRYQGVSDETIPPSPTDGDDRVATMEGSPVNVASPHIINVGSPVQQGLAQLKPENASWPKQRIRRWLSVTGNEYACRSKTVELSVLPSWPTVAAATESLTHYNPCEYLITIWQYY